MGYDFEHNWGQQTRRGQWDMSLTLRPAMASTESAASALASAASALASAASALSSAASALSSAASAA